MRLIDADALLNRMRKDPLFDLVERYGVSGVIKAEPTVDAVPVRHGKWIFGSTLGHSWMKCSECCVSQDGQTLCFSYCPNCGAKMDGERKEE